MIDSRDVSSLMPRVRDMALAHQSLAAAEGITLLITSTFRDAEAQAKLYALMLGIDYQHLRNDDLGAFQAINKRLGRGGRQQGLARRDDAVAARAGTAVDVARLSAVAAVTAPGVAPVGARSAAVVSSDGSDHLPVVARLRWREEG